MGVQPDFIVCRSDHEITLKVREKIAAFCDVPVDNVLACEDSPSIYEVPIKLHEQEFEAKVLAHVGLSIRRCNLKPLQAFLKAMNSCTDSVKIGIVGKYTSLPDAYLSVIEALHHAGVYHHCNVDAQLIDGESLTKENVDEVLSDMDGILIPGGFGQRAFEGKILAAQFAREHNVPFLGICLGLQAAVCEFARNVAGLEGATSAEFDECAPYPLIHIMPEQANINDKGGTMRLGAYPCVLAPDTKSASAYGTLEISERHRHRYEVNNDFRDQLTQAGMVIAGTSPDGRLVEMIELPDHPWFVASQGHPEFKSRPTKPHPLFLGLVSAALARQKQEA